MKSFVEGIVSSSDAHQFHVREDGGTETAVRPREPATAVALSAGQRVSIVGEVGADGVLVGDSILLIGSDGSPRDAGRPVPAAFATVVGVAAPAPRWQGKKLLLGGLAVVAGGVAIVGGIIDMTSGLRSAWDQNDPSVLNPATASEPVADNRRPAPYLGKSGWPADTVQPQPQAQAPIESPPDAPGDADDAAGTDGDARLAPPGGMQPVDSSTGHVFTSRLNGSPQASKLGQALLLGVTDYFDAAPRILSTQTEPQERFTQTAFNATLHGAPVSGMLVVVSDGQNGGTGYLMFDRSASIQQSLPGMMQAARQASESVRP